MIEPFMSRRVLIVEDEGMVAMLLEDMLADLGHEVVATVGRLELAAKAISEAKFDFAVLDVNLDGARTYPLAAMLKERDIPFVFATGYGMAGLDPEWASVPVLQKPFQLEQLERIIRRI
ncbi:MAG: response regulator [Hyphomicrobiales bacterium]|nr:response regulator [Hyphomicrobiales bacterium]